MLTQSGKPLCTICTCTKFCRSTLQPHPEPPSATPHTTLTSTTRSFLSFAWKTRFGTHKPQRICVWVALLDLGVFSSCVCRGEDYSGFGGSNTRKTHLGHRPAPALCWGFTVRQGASRPSELVDKNRLLFEAEEERSVPTLRHTTPHHTCGTSHHINHITSHHIKSNDSTTFFQDWT